jgi:Mor family transcriptional regulator
VNKTIDSSVVDEIRQACANGERQAEVAKRHNVSRSAVCRIVNGSRHATESNHDERIEDTADSH